MKRNHKTENASGSPVNPDAGHEGARGSGVSQFDEWWNRDGRFYDPDTSDVPWFDKRKDLAERAFDAAMAQSRNYTADSEVEPQEFTFTNGRRVKINWTEFDKAHLTIEAEGQP